MTNKVNFSKTILALTLCIVALGARAAAFFDDFESYAVGSNLHGQGGWAGWAGNPGAGALVSTNFSFSPTRSVNITGASDLVHTFSGATNGSWVFSVMQYIPSTSTGTNYTVLLNTYQSPYGTNDLNWSVQIQNNMDSGQIISDLGGSATLPMVKDQWVEVRCEINLASNSVSEFYNGQLLSTHVWQGGLGGPGLNEIQALDLFANNAGPVYYDNVSLGASVQEPDFLNVTGTYNGTINGGAVSATSTGQLNPLGNGPNILNVAFSALPATFHPYALGISVTTIICWGAAGTPNDGSQNLFDLTGGNYTMARTFTWPSLPGSSITATGVVATVGTNMTYTMNLSGTYAGPTDLIGVVSYQVRWRQGQNGTLLEEGSAIVQRSGGATLQVNIQTVYGGVSGTLAANQVGSATANELTFDVGTGQYHLNWSATQSLESALLNVTGTYNGTINGGAVSATSTGQLNPLGNGPNILNVAFSALPATFHPYALGISVTTIICWGAAGTPNDGSQNLFDLTGGNYTMARTFTWPSLPGSSITATGVVATVGTNMTYTMNLSGTYAGPTDLIGVVSYQVRWRQGQNGTLLEEGSAIVQRSGGATLQVNIQTVYGGVSGTLAANQVGSATANELTFDVGTGQYHLNWSATQSLESALLNVTGTYNGTINGGAVSATSTGQLNPLGNGPNILNVAFSALPATFHPYALGISVTTIICWGAAGTPNDGSQNLFDLTGGNYTMARTFTWPSLPGSSITATGVVATVGANMTYTMNLSGTYAGPTDLIGVVSYQVRWRQGQNGTLLEEGSAIVQRSGGATLQVNIQTVYGGVSGTLAANQVGSATANELTFDVGTGQYHLNWSATQSLESALLNVTGTCNGTINGGAVSATSTGQLNPLGNGPNILNVAFSALPATFHPYALGISVTTIICWGAAGTPNDGSQNLFDLTGGNYTMARTFTWPSLPGSSITATGVVATVGANMTYTMNLSGTYAGPTDLIGVVSYQVRWRQGQNGTLLEEGSAIVQRSGGATLQVNIQTVYGGVSGTLAANQVGSATANELTFDVGTGQYHLNWSATQSLESALLNVTGTSNGTINGGAVSATARAS